MSKSIINNAHECAYCHRDTDDLHKHHIFSGTANRAKSETYGCWVFLCPDHHTNGRFAVHNNAEMDRELKRRAQKEWEKRYGSREDFIATFGRNYL